jgi:hypothetical protein
MDFNMEISSITYNSDSSKALLHFNKLKNNQYEVNVYKQGSGTNTTIYIVNKKGSTAGIYINAYTAEEAIEGYKNFMK